MNGFGRLAAVLAVATLLGGCTSATGPELSSMTAGETFAATKPAKPAVLPQAQIYMFRGGFNGVFSTGITDMAKELNGMGIPARSLSWTEANPSLSKIRAAVKANPRTGPIILAGHSLGASTALSMAKQLTAQGITVDLLILFDPLGASDVPKGVRRFIDFKASGDKSNPGKFRPGPGFTGQIVSVDIRNLPNLDKSSHWNIVNQPELQNRVINEINAVYRNWKPRRAAG